MTEYNITLNQFANFALKNSIQKYNCAHRIFRQITSEFDKKQDYWVILRNRVSKALRTTGTCETLLGLEQEVPTDKKSNYQIMVNGLNKYWGKKSFEAVSVQKRIWKSGHIRINVNPLLCYSYRNKIHIVDLYLHVNDNDKIDKRKADMILQVMHDALKLPDEVSIEILDVARGKTFKYHKVNGDKLALTAKLEAKQMGEFFDEFSKA